VLVEEAGRLAAAALRVAGMWTVERLCEEVEDGRGIRWWAR
jgi:hypothetical protein